MVDQLVGKERVPRRELLLNDLVSLMACHAAVRAGDRLTQEEIKALLAQRDLAQDSHHFPHGRPTSENFAVLPKSGEMAAVSLLDTSPFARESTMFLTSNASL